VSGRKCSGSYVVIWQETLFWLRKYLAGSFLSLCSKSHSSRPIQNEIWPDDLAALVMLKSSQALHTHLSHRHAEVRIQRSRIRVYDAKTLKKRDIDKEKILQKLKI